MREATRESSPERCLARVARHLRSRPVRTLGGRGDPARLFQRRGPAWPNGRAPATVTRKTSTIASSAASQLSSQSAASRRPASPASSAAIRAFYGALIRAGEASANPADLVATPKRDRKLPRVLSREEMQTLLDRIPTRTPLEMRDGAMLELPTRAGSEPRRSSTWIRTRRTSTASGCASRARAGRRAWFPWGNRRRRRSADISSAPGPPWLVPSLRMRSWSRRAGGACIHPTFAAGSSAGCARRRSPVESPLRPPDITFATHLLEGGADLRSIQGAPRARQPLDDAGYTQVEPSWLQSQYARSHPRA